jgi:hypothetical protein
VGIERSREALELARAEFQSDIASGYHELIAGDLLDLEQGSTPKPDIGLSLMVMEHLPYDAGFLMALMAQARPGGYILISVPGRRDRWSFEDETVGHLRRYDRPDVQTVLRRAGASDIVIRSVSVLVVNLLHGGGNMLLKRASSRLPRVRKPTPAG